MKKVKKYIQLISAVIILSGSTILLSVSQVNAMSLPITDLAISQCGSRGDAITTSIDFGCYGATCRTHHPLPYCQHTHNAIIDLLFAIIRFITDGVGLIIIASLIIAGIQYTTSRGEPKQLNQATKRIQSTATALLLFFFVYAIINYVIPNGFFGQ
jgi:hypothetical protein